MTTNLTSADAPEAAKTAEAPEAAKTAPTFDPIRQWITLNGSSMDLRIGEGLIRDAPRFIRMSFGKPYACMILHDHTVDMATIEKLYEDVASEGFTVSVQDVVDIKADGQKPLQPTLRVLDEVSGVLAKAHITADDLLIALGDVAVASLASHLAHSWCGGVQMAYIPTSLTSAVMGALTPAALQNHEHNAQFELDASARFEFIDMTLLAKRQDQSELERFYALVVESAVASSLPAVESLWDSTARLLAATPEALAIQLAETLRQRSRIIASTSVAQRQAIHYADALYQALCTLARRETVLDHEGTKRAEVAYTKDGSAFSELHPQADTHAPALPYNEAVFRAESMRFSARLAAALGKLSVDDVLLQDELLDTFKLGYVEARIEPSLLANTLERLQFEKNRRLSLALPLALGRVRLTPVPTELLREHVMAWCEVHNSV